MPQGEAFSLLCPRTALERVSLSAFGTPRSVQGVGVTAASLGQTAASGHVRGLRAEAGLGVQPTDRSVSYHITVAQQHQ